MARMGSQDNTRHLLAFLGVGVRTSAEIQARFGWSQPTVSRMLAKCGAEVVAIGQTRSRRYTRLRDIRGLGGRFPVYKIDDEGNARLWGMLFAVAHEIYLWAPVQAQEELYRGLPWFISDLRPEGFVGRAFVREFHLDLLLPPRGTDWNDAHVLIALARRGENCMGNLIVGEESLGRYLAAARKPAPPLAQDLIAAEYPVMAKAAMYGQPVGSYAGGEQPKFTAVIERGGEGCNVLVKFSPAVSSPTGRRWADLLICEHHALQVIHEARIAAAESRILEAGGQVFLEVARFDRVGRSGRRPIISLRAVDDEFYGHQDNWIAAAGRLQADGRLSPDDAATLRWLAVFGDLIANTDQHFGNISLIMVDDGRRFTLTPVYDMLPMLYRPREAEVTNPTFNPPAAAPLAPSEWDSALAAAVVFWSRVAEDGRISAPFRGICTANLAAVMELQSGPRLIL